MINYNSPQVTLDEIVFEHRNKVYGAYFLRKIYDDNILIAMLIGSLFFTLAVTSPLILAALRPGSEERFLKEVVIDMANLPAPPPTNTALPPPPPLQPIAPPPAVKTIKFTPPEVASDELVQQQPPSMDEIKKNVIASVNQEGALDAPFLDNIDVVGDGNDIGIVEAPADGIFIVVEQMPVLPGLSEYLAKHIKYPGQASRNDVQGRVDITAIISPDGTVTDARIVRGIGYGCDEEALRVVNKLPKWNPGKQGGRSVPVRVAIPINFKLSN